MAVTGAIRSALSPGFLQSMRADGPGTNIIFDYAFPVTPSPDLVPTDRFDSITAFSFSLLVHLTKC